MTEPGLSKKRKRLIAAGLLLWIAVAYPLSLCPVAYVVGRGWLPVTAVQAFYAPITATVDALRPHPGIGLAPPDAEGRRKYVPLPDPSPPIVEAAAVGYLNTVEWFARLGERHAMSR